jgi:hypothetical protein
VHDLWRGQVGTDSATFDPFLTNMNASFQFTPATIAGLALFVGLRPRPQPVQPPPPDTTQGPQLGGQQDASGFRQYQGATRDESRGTGAYGRQFSLGVGYTSTRTRPIPLIPATDRPGIQSLTLNLAFSPTKNWTATWGTSLNMVTGAFDDHLLTFQRDLRRWRASFSFSKTGAGNLAFSFNITLTDQPDIKMDYDQRTYSQ